MNRRNRLRSPVFQEPDNSKAEGPARPSHAASFLTREADGSARPRIRFSPEQVALFEEAAGDTPVIDWIRQTLDQAARRQVANARRRRPNVGPPEESDTSQ